jgi:hypothetical protein
LTSQQAEAVAAAEEVSVEAVVAADSEIVTVEVVAEDSVAEEALVIVVAEEDSVEETDLVEIVTVAEALATEAASEDVEETEVASESHTEDFVDGCLSTVPNCPLISAKCEELIAGASLGLIARPRIGP